MKKDCSNIKAKKNIKCQKNNSQKIYKFKIFNNFDCFDEFDNYLGKAELINGNLIIKKDG